MSNVQDGAIASVPASTPKQPYLRRPQAAKYVEETWGIPCSPKSLAKWAVVGCGSGPAFRKAGKFPIYETADLDAWAEAKIGPRVHSTSELRGA
jgi:hypothetical protein